MHLRVFILENVEDLCKRFPDFFEKIILKLKDIVDPALQDYLSRQNVISNRSFESVLLF